MGLTGPPQPRPRPNFFEIKDESNQIVARLSLTLGAFFVDLVKTNKNAEGVFKFDMDGRRVKSYGKYTFNKTDPTISAKKTFNHDADKGNRTKIDVVFSYNESSTDSELKVQTAEFKFAIEWGWNSSVTRGDYWNLTSAGLKLTGTFNETESLNLIVDLTPKFSYTGKPGDTACTTGYGICAPVNLCWTCTKQTLAPTNLTAVGAEEWTLMWTLPGMMLEPEWGNKMNFTGGNYTFSAPWDCDPLVPLPVWVGLLISLFLASLLLWAIQMLTALQTPNKWDDPKKPGIQVAQTE